MIGMTEDDPLLTMAEAAAMLCVYRALWWKMDRDAMDCHLFVRERPKRKGA
jgi:hypothetical protein